MDSLGTDRINRCGSARSSSGYRFIVPVLLAGADHVPGRHFYAEGPLLHRVSRSKITRPRDEVPSRFYRNPGRNTHDKNGGFGKASTTVSISVDASLGLCALRIVEKISFKTPPTVCSHACFVYVGDCTCPSVRRNKHQ